MANINNIPPDLTARPQWVCWEARPKDNGKTDKIPIDPKTGRGASHSNPETWGTFQQAFERYQSGNGKLAGIGYVFSAEDPHCGIDLDGCRNSESGQVEPWANDIIKQLNSYTEISPSGTGVHIVCEAMLPRGGRRNEHVEMYDENRFFCVTGEHLHGTPRDIKERQTEILLLHRKIFGDQDQEQTSPQGGATPANLDDTELLQKAFESKNGDRFNLLYRGLWEDVAYPSQSEADQALCNMLAFWCGNDPERIDRLFRQSGLYRDKWDKKHYGNGDTYGDRTIQKAIASTTEVFTTPNKEPEAERKAIQEENKQGEQKAQRSKKPQSRGIKLNELRKSFSTDTTYVWREHFPEGQPIILNGREGIGKTTIGMVAGKEILEERSTGSVLWLATEGKVLDTVNKMEALGLNDRFYVAQKADGTFKFNFQWASDLRELDIILNDLEKPILVVFIDSIRGMSNLGDNDDKIGGVMNRVNAIVCDKYHACLVYIDHWGKGKKDDILDRNVGTTAKTAAVSAVISVVSKTKYTRDIKLAKSNIGSIPDLISMQAGEQVVIRQPHEESAESMTNRAEALLLELGARQTEWPASEVYKMAEAESINIELLKKVKQSLNISSQKESFNGQWSWKWPL